MVSLNFTWLIVTSVVQYKKSLFRFLRDCIFTVFEYPIRLSYLATITLPLDKLWLLLHDIADELCFYFNSVLQLS